MWLFNLLQIREPRWLGYFDECPFIVDGGGESRREAWDWNSWGCL